MSHMFRFSVRFLVSASSTPLKMLFLVTVMFSKCIRVSDCLHTSIYQNASVLLIPRTRINDSKWRELLNLEPDENPEQLIAR
jgi:hypothetical protein